jgi:hypothetical protein
MLSVFFLKRGPHRQVLVCGVEVKDTLHSPQKVNVYSEKALSDYLRSSG